MLRIAELRREHYGASNVGFLRSPDPDDLPAEIGTSLRLLSAVFEHMLPRERLTLLPRIWALSSETGSCSSTRHPIATTRSRATDPGSPSSTTSPDAAASVAARRLTNRVARDQAGSACSGRGCRGGTQGEVLGILQAAGDGRPVLLRPSRLGLADEVDIWYAYSMKRNPREFKRVLRLGLKGVSRLTGFGFSPDLNLAIAKR